VTQVSANLLMAVMASANKTVITAPVKQKLNQLMKTLVVKA